MVHTNFCYPQSDIYPLNWSVPITSSISQADRPKEAINIKEDMLVLI